MKISKMLIFIICVILSLVITNEMRVIYFLRDIKTNCGSFYLDKNSSNSILIKIDEIATKNSVIVYTINENNQKKENLNFKIYNTSSLISNMKYSYSKHLKSLIYGNIVIEEKPISLFNDFNTRPYFCVKGSEKEISSFIQELNEYAILFDIHINRFMYADQCSMIIKILWIVISIFLFFVSYYHVSLQKREKMIQVCYGHSLCMIMIKAIIFDLIILIPSFILIILGVKNFFSLVIDKDLIIYMTILLIISIIPYFTYSLFSLKSISHENKLLRKIVIFSRIFKVCITFLLIGIIIIASNISNTLIQSYKANTSLKHFHKYECLKVSSTDLSNVPFDIMEMDEIVAQSFSDRILLKDLYIRYFNECDITIINNYEQSDENGDFNIIYCNKNAKKHISNYFSDVNTDNSEPNIYYFIPENESNNAYRMQIIKSVLANINNTECLDEKEVYYKRDIEYSYFDINNSNIISLCNNPYVIYDTTEPSNKMNLYIDNVTLVLNMNDRIKTELTQRDDLKYEAYQIADNINYIISKSQKEILSLLFILCSMIIIEVIITYNIIKFDYRMNLKEYCIKKALGYGIIKKNKKQILSLLFLYVISTLSFIFIPSINFVFVIVCNSILAFLDVILLLIFSVQVEKKRVLNVLKGGFL